MLRINNQPASGLSGFFDYLLNSDFNVCILSNSSLSTGEDVKQFFSRHSLNCPFPVFTAIDTAVDYVKSRYTKVDVFVAENVKYLFKDLLSNENPDAVIIGDIGEAWTFDKLNDIFLKVSRGADLVAIHKNKYWDAPGRGLILDAGPFIKAIEYAASKEAVIIGKPSAVYFCTALEKMGMQNYRKAIMIGDDPETDIKGIQQIGGRGILIYTGKTKFPYRKSKKIKVDFEAMNLSEAETVLRKIEKE